MARRFRLTEPVVREPALHRQIADAFRLEIGPPGRLSRLCVTWWSVDMACYGGNAPGIRTTHGCIAGIPDIQVLWRGRGYFIEVKARDGVLSPEQQAVGTTILGAEAHFGIARNDLEAIALLDRWGIPRAHVIREAA